MDTSPCFTIALARSIEFAGPATDHKEVNPDGFVEDLRGWTIDTDPFQPLTKSLRDKYDRDMSRDPNELLGYNLTRFAKLAKNVDGIQPGFYVVAAETNAGKTAFLCNLALDLLDPNDDLVGLYFSLDDSRDVILNRFFEYQIESTPESSTKAANIG